MKLKPVLLLVALAQPASAADLGTFGEVWDVREQNLLTVIQTRLKDHFAGRSQADIQKELQDRVTESAMRPAPVEGVGRGPKTWVRQFDPAIVSNQEMADHNGTVFVRKGQRVSPFDVIPVFNETLYFIDGDDAEQVAWMKQQKPTTVVSKIILVSGSIKDSAEALDSRIYFDQGGAIVRRFGIKQTPAVITQEPGKPLLRITEIGLP
ncbi:type-F conjugative transfer system protein TraW [Serratia liquefaciens]|uniref:type-F conjugative transfer system protein TraW n=1 Tax=Serratia liquefaciens TaxID=614 RepID=UPI00301C3037